jgi:hypothetical protein
MVKIKPTTKVSFGIGSDEAEEEEEDIVSLLVVVVVVVVVGSKANASCGHSFRVPTREQQERKST